MTIAPLRRLRGATMSRLAVALVTLSAGSAILASSAAAAVAPANTALPAVTGTLVVGSTLTATTGTWTGDAPIAFAYRWQRCDASAANCADIAGATASTYVLAALDSGSTFRAAVTASNGAGSQTVNSATTAVVANAPGAPANTALPTIAGTTTAGSTLTATTGTWTGNNPITFTSAWRRCDAAGATCQTIAGATGLTYLLGADDVGHTLRFEVGALNGAGAALATSAQTAVVAAAPTTGKPTSIKQCKRGGWRTFTNPSFRNQGQCVRSVVAASLGNGRDGNPEHRGHGRAEGHDSNAQGQDHGHGHGHGHGHDKGHGDSNEQ